MSILEVIRRSCSRETLIKARRLVEKKNVYLVSTGEELNFEVFASKNQFHSVSLWEEDDDWDCDCGDHQPCEHILAAALAFSEGKVRKQNARKIGYRFSPCAQGLIFSRVIIEKGKETPFVGSIFRNFQGKFRQIDQQIERRLFNEFNRVLSKDVLSSIFKYLQNATDVDIKLEGKKITVALERVTPVGLVEDKDNGFCVRIIRDPKIQKVYGNGVVLYDNTLRLTGRGGLTNRDYQKYLRAGIFYDEEDIELLVCEVIPDLQKKIPVDVRTTKLPPSHKVTPYLLIDLLSEGNDLVIQPKIVYGTPPVAEIVGEGLKFLGGYIPFRDRSKELQLRRRATNVLNLPVGPRTTFSGEKAVSFASRLLHFVDKEKDWVVKKDVLNSFKRVDGFTPEIIVNEDNFDIDWGPASEEAVFSAWRNGSSLVRLNSGGWAPIPDEWLKEYGYLVASLLESRNRNVGKELPAYAIFEFAKLCEKLNQPDPPNLRSLRQLIDNFKGIKQEVLPDDLQADLRPYQNDGVNWLCFLKRAELGGILADDMGLGKTIQALCVLHGRTLVVAPTSVLHNWKQETHRFRPKLTVCLYHGTNRVYDEKANVVLTSYALLRNNLDLFKKEQWDVIVLDEAQAIKNPKSQTALAAYSLRAKFRLALTGTPIENRLQELWSQMHFLCPGLLSGLSDFRRTYENPISNGNQQALQSLKDKIRPFVLRRLKKEVAKDLPSRTEVTLRCSLSESEKVLYDAVRATTSQQIVRLIGEKKFSIMKALEALLRLRQASCHSGLLPDQSALTSSKIELLIQNLTQLIQAGHKALVFSQWTKFLDFIEPHLRQNNINFVRLDGSTRDRKAVVDLFQSPDGPPIFLSSLKAGGTGLNLTAADHVFLMDPWWNPAAEDQAADRAHRIGQDKPVFIHRIIAMNTVEERILELQNKKRRISQAALGDASQTTSITKQELLALLVE